MDPGRIPESNRSVEFLLAVVFLGQYVTRFVVINANHRTLEHLVVFFAFVAPVIAYFMSRHSESVRNSYMSAGVLAIFYPARFLRLHYALNRVLAILASSTNYLRLTLIRQEAASLGGDIIVAILVFASVVHSGINWYSQANKVEFTGFTFLDAIYFISMSALGQDGSIPRSTFSEIISMAIVALIAFAVPSRVTRLVDLALKTSAYNKTVALPAASRHALICGNIELESIRQFLHEFFNADHGPNIFRTTIVILHNDEPSMEMKALLRDPAYANRVFYVKGKATSFKSLKRARIDLATCVYILARKHSHGSGISDDADTVLIALALNAFATSAVTRRPNGKSTASLLPKFQVYAQTLLPGSISHLHYLQTARVVCVDEMRMGIMAQNCATPGFATLAFMLSTSVAGHVDWDFSGVLAEAIAKSADDTWVKSYIHGISQEIYQAHVPSSLTGKSFFKVARYFYRCHGMLVFSVGSFSHNRSPHAHSGHHPSVNADCGYYQVLLSPRNYILQKYDMLFAISTDVQSVLSAMQYAERVSIKSAKVKSHAGAEKRHSLGAPPLQTESSPRRMVARTPPPSVVARPHKANYISDSDSSYFSPNIGYAAPSIKGVVRTRIERVARHNDVVPLGLSNHIVVCDASSVFPRNAELLIQSLKNAFEDDSLAVVILSPGALDPQRALVLSDFANVYVVCGTPLAQSDLRRTHIERAQKAIVLGNCNVRADSTDNESSDSAAILANMNIQSLCGSLFVTTELVDAESIRYLDHTQLLGEPLLKRTFMGGHIFMPAMIDTALCQCYFSSHILDVLRHLTFSHHAPSDHAVVPTPRADEEDGIRAFRPGKLSLLYVPARFVGKRYDTLVLTLMKQHAAVPLAIYRIVSHDAQAFATVMCNPSPSMPLVHTDAVYVLGPQIAGWSHVSEGLRALNIAPPPQSAFASEAVSPISAATAKSGHGTGSSQSRHTVYSHNTAPSSHDADADVSDEDT
ncbi:hypothetical protein GGI20_005672 [Coemansia sp. BCRC 34301]|nr:hypothetical protein GGI20_005672 [Coemansia sp. BCRC 34301]